MAFLQIFRELLSLGTFLTVHSKAEGIQTWKLLVITG